MEGYEQLCRVRGTVGVAATVRRGLGQRGHSWGNPDWDKIALTRAVGAWFDDGSGVVLAHGPLGQGAAPRRRGAWGALLDARGTREVDEVRLSTTTDEAAARSAPASSCGSTRTTTTRYRGTGEVLTGSTLELGALRLDVAFFRWHIEGRTGDRPLRRDPPRVIKAVVSDFGGVVTLPLIEGVHARPRGDRHPARRAAQGDGSSPPRATASRRCSSSSAARSPSPSSSPGSRRRSARCSTARSRSTATARGLMGELRAERAAARLLPRAARRARHPAGDPDQQRARVARRLAHAAARRRAVRARRRLRASRACASPSRRSTR